MIIIEVSGLPPLEDIVKFNMEDINSPKCRQLKHTSGVYFLFNKGEIVYIGKSERLHTRIQEHKHKGRTKKFDSFGYIPISSREQFSLIELYLIYKYKPKYNKKI